jgi:hypothetical protein
MTWKDQLNGDSLTWLLEPDSPGVRYLALRDLLDISETDPDFRSARQAAHEGGPIAEVLVEMETAGYWSAPGPGYNPKYRSTVWSVTLLAQLGATVQADPRIEKTCEYLLDHALTKDGQLSMSGVPSGSFDCLQGNMCWALLALGCEDARLEKAYDWMARSQTGEGIEPASHRNAPIRYYAAKCGPNFACGANYGLSCAWGAAKVMMAFGRLEKEKRTPVIERAIQKGVDFLFSVDPAEAAYPSGGAEKPSRNWWKFGFPLFYITDILQIAEALTALGYSRDPRLTNTIALIRKKQDPQGRWALEYDYAGKTWGNYGTKGQPNKWVTLRALRVLKAVDDEPFAASSDL